jgi:ankyrin repeat protein
MIGSTGVMVASSIGNLPILKLLVEEYSADINLRNQNGTSALVFACNTNQLEIVSYLCDRGADINCVIESGDTPLTIASSNGYDNIIRTLSNSQHAIVDYLHQNSEGKTALLCAIEHGHCLTVSTLISSEPDQASINFISEVSSMSVSPLVLASLYGETEIVRILLSHQADHSLISDRIICSQKSPKYDIEDIEEEDVSDTQLYFNQEEIQLRRQLIRSELLRARWLPRLDVRRCCELDDINSLQSLLKEYHHSPEVLSLLTIQTVSSSGNATALMVACLHGSVKVVEEIFTLAASYPSHFNVRVLSSSFSCFPSLVSHVDLLTSFSPVTVVHHSRWSQCSLLRCLEWSLNFVEISFRS